MAEGINFVGANVTYTGDGDSISDLHVFRNSMCVVSCWKLSDEELAEINVTGCVFLSVFSGGVLHPVFVGSENSVRPMVADYGGAWKRD